MLFQELQALDGFNAFSSFISVEHAIVLNIIPAEFAPYFPDKCDDCDSDNIITSNRKTLMCCNPRCTAKLYHSMNIFFENFSCKGMGPETCKKLTARGLYFSEVRSHISLVTLEDGQLFADQGSANYVNFKLAMNKVSASNITYGEMVSKLAIPTLGSTAIKIMGKLPSTSAFLEAVEKAGGLRPYLQTKGVYDPMVGFYLAEFLPDILHAEELIFRNLRSNGHITIEFCMTGSNFFDGRKISKEEFVVKCNQLGRMSNGVQLFDVKLNKSIGSTHYLVAQGPSGNAQYVQAAGRQAAERKRIIFTADEFYAYLEEVIACIMEDKPFPELSLAEET